MKIYSWNILFRNSKLDRAFEFIAKSDFDVFCLQEVPPLFLERLRSLPYYSAYAIDTTHIAATNYLLILSRHPVLHQNSFTFPDYWPVLPLRTRIFMHVVHPFFFLSKIKNRSGLYVDLQTPEGIIRVFNLHLILAHPALRLKEFEIAMAERTPEGPTIVCGDFNILEAIGVNIFNWFFGGTYRDAFSYRRERVMIEEKFIEHELTNPLRGEITHPISLSQLDHILVCPNFSIQKAAVLPDRTGSDHHPIFVETLSTS